MAIAPIDLQTLFTQMDKAAKIQSPRESQVIHQAVQNVQQQRKLEEQAHQVTAAQDTGDGAEKIKDQDEREHQQSEKRKKQKQEEETAAAPSVVLSEPNLGKNIDISL